MITDFNRFMFLWFGQLLSQIGNGMTIFGLGVYVYVTTGNAGNVAFITLAGFLPLLLVTPFSGILVDRYDRRLLMMLGDSLSISGLIYILIILKSGSITPWQIGIGLGLSSVFSSLVEPAYRATVSDLLPLDQFTKASGLVQIASASKFLISPTLAGIILTKASIEVILILDASTFVVTAIASLLICKSMGKSKEKEIFNYKTFFLEIMEGWNAVSKIRGVLLLVIFGMLLTFAIGFIQVLAGPLLLTFTSKLMLGYAQTAMALGMLLASIVVSSIAIGKNHTSILVVSIIVSAIGMIFFPIKRNVLWVTTFGFIFFASLPFINACIDYLIRINIDNALQGRAWGIIGLISQLGYLVAYLSIGLLAESVFEPLLNYPNQHLVFIQRILGVGEGTGIAFMIVIGGICLFILALLISKEKSIYQLEKGKIYD